MMFSGLMGGAILNVLDPDKERSPPQEPTPLTFPIYEPSSSTDWLEGSSCPDFQALFSRITKPADISHAHAESLNIHLVESCRIEHLLPAAYLPDLPHVPASDAASKLPDKNRQATTSSRQDDFEARLSELRIDNDLAFRSLTSRLPKGTKPLRLLHLRKFWVGLENMSPYWDCSLDQFTETCDSPAGNEEKDAKRVCLDSGIPTNEDQRFLPVENLVASSEEVNVVEAAASHSKHSASVDIPPSGRSVTANPDPKVQVRYKGRRTSTGRDMPDQFRADAVRGLVECAAHPFQSTLAPPRHMPIVRFNKLNVPVRQTAAVYRVSRDRTKAREGRHEGPFLALQIRSDTDFALPDGELATAKARQDLMREIGGVLQLAQERRREGRTEIKPGQGMWYTTQPRWGGGPGGEVQSDLPNAIPGPTPPAKDHTEKIESKYRRRRPPAALQWKELRCGSGFWDNRTDYKAIGKHPSSPYDEVFLVSSLNTHISILKLTVHVAYTDCTVSGTFPATPPAEPDWCRPRLERTQWFDLFDVEQRVDAFRALWGVLAYLTREIEVEGPSAESEDSWNGFSSDGVNAQGT